MTHVAYNNSRSLQINDTDGNGGAEVSGTHAVAALLFVTLLDIFVIVANAMIMVAFLKDAKLRVARNYYIFSLAIADFATGIITVPLYAHTIPDGRWTIGQATCIIWNVLDDVCLFSSHMSMLLISYDRYLLVNQAFAYHAFETPKKATLRILVLWCTVFAVKLAGILVGEWYYSKTSDETSCSPIAVVDIPYIIGLKTYDIASTSISCVIEVFIPLILMIYFNLCVYMRIRDKTRRNSCVINNLVTNTLVQPYHISPRREAERSLSSENQKEAAGKPAQLQGSETQEARGSFNNGRIRPEYQKRRSVPSATSQAPGLDTIQETDDDLTTDDHEHSSDSEVSAEEEQRKIYQREFSQWLGDTDILKMKLSIIASTDSLDLLDTRKQEQFAYRPPEKPRKGLLKSKCKVEPLENGQSTSNFSDVTAPAIDIASTSSSTEVLSDSVNIASSMSEISLSRKQKSRANLQYAVPVWQNQATCSTSNPIKSSTHHHRSNNTITAIDSLSPHSANQSRASARSNKGQTKPGRSVRFSDPIVTKARKSRSPREVNRRLSQCSTVVVPRYKMKLDRKAGITLLLLVGFFLCFKVPFAAIMMILAICRNCVSNTVYEIFTWLFRAKVLVNPFLYAFICQRFRNYYINLFKRFTKCSTGPRASH